MPELPEVETIVRQLAGCLVGQHIVDTVVYWPPTVATHTPDDFAAALQGRAISSVRRRAKYVIIGVPPQVLIIHLRMTGRLCLGDTVASPCADDYVRVRWLFGAEALRLSDLRKFGRVYLVDDAEQVLGGLGPEPFDETLTDSTFAAMLHSRRRQLKPLLLDQHFMAGLGNIYVDEALWRARLHPLTRADTLSPCQAGGLLAAIRSTLNDAITHGGTTLRDYRNAYNEAGGYGRALAVYGRAGKSCPRCGAPIRRLVVGERGAHVCEQCQPRPGRQEVGHGPDA